MHAFLKEITSLLENKYNSDMNIHHHNMHVLSPEKYNFELKESQPKNHPISSIILYMTFRNTTSQLLPVSVGNLPCSSIPRSQSRDAPRARVREVSL